MYEYDLKPREIVQSFPNDFPDTKDVYRAKERLLKRVIRGLNLDEKKWPPRPAAGFINARKDEGLRAQHLDDSGVTLHVHCSDGGARSLPKRG